LWAVGLGWGQKGQLFFDDFNFDKFVWTIIVFDNINVKL
jgi:hypothetical protein